MGGSVGKLAGQAARGGAAVFSGGISEGINAASKGKIYNKLGMSGGPMGTMTGMVGRTFGFGNSDTPNIASVNGGQSNPDLLAQTGGAPVLANIAMGVSPKDALAGYLGVDPSNWDSYVQNLSPKDSEALTATQKQLETIQSNTQLRQQAVQKVIDDFPNITAKIAHERAASGEEFDSVTQGYMKHVLDSTAAKFAAGGGLSSGAANEAFAKTGADMGLKKLDYMGQREATSQQRELAGYGSRLAEVNALRDFQNTMIAGKVSEGFSAAQANLGRIANADMNNTNNYNQRAMADRQQENASTNAMFGALGSLGGAWLGGSLLKSGSAMASMPEERTERTGYFNAVAPNFYNTSYGRTVGGR